MTRSIAPPVCDMFSPVKNTRKLPSRLPSRVTVEGLDRAPHRAFLRALGLSADDLAKPFVGVASTDGRVTPCNALLGEFARAACAAVREAGGVAFDFASLSVADSMSMNDGGMHRSVLARGCALGGARAGSEPRGAGRAACRSISPRCGWPTRCR